MNEPFQTLTSDEHFSQAGGKGSFARIDREKVNAEKARQIAAMKARQHGLDLRVADYVESHPEAIEAAKAYVQRFLFSERHKRFHWILDQWRELLQTKSPAELADILRDTSDATEELRSSPPFCGIHFDS